MSKDEWTNQEKIDLRSKIALKVLLIIFKVLSPYRFASQFEKDIAQLEKDIYSL